MDQYKKTTIPTICWGCAPALRIPGVACTWSLHAKPVPGWTAIRSDIYAQVKSDKTKRTTESYIVQKCPLFLSDADYQKNNKNKEANNMSQGINTSNTPRMDRFDRNTKAIANEITLKEKIILLPATEDFDVGATYAAFLGRDGKRIELAKDKDGYTVSGTGRGGAGRVIRCEVLGEAMKKRGTVLPQTVPIKRMEDGKWFAELKAEPVEAEQ